MLLQEGDNDIPTVLLKLLDRSPVDRDLVAPPGRHGAKLILALAGLEACAHSESSLARRMQ